jgi:type I restriction enzyme S subunit
MSRFRPYPAYKDSGVEWLGEVPEHWETKPLFTHLREREVKNTGNREQRVLSLSYGRIIERDVESNFGLLPESFETYQIVEPDNIVMRLTDLQNDQRSLRVGRVRERGIITSAYVCLEAKGNIDSSFAHYLLHCYDLLKVFYGLGGGVRQTMKFEDLKRLPILRPSTEEQALIAAFLDRETAKIDALVAKKERMIELLQEKRTVLITRAVTKGLDPTVPMKDSGVEWMGEIPAHWEVKRLKHLTEDGLVNGLFKKKEQFGSGVKIVNVTNIYEKSFFVDFESLDTVEADSKEINVFKVQSGDIFFVRSSLKLEGVAASACAKHVEEPAVFECHLVRIRPLQKEIIPEYLIHYLNSSLIRQRLISLAEITTMTTIAQPKLSSLQIVLPPMDEQLAILTSLYSDIAKLDSFTTKIREAIDRLKEYRTALISAAVTGKIDVRDM